MPEYRKADQLFPSVLLGDMGKSRGGGSLENVYLKTEKTQFHSTTTAALWRADFLI